MKVELYECRKYVCGEIELATGKLDSFERVAATMHALTDALPFERMYLFVLNGRNLIIGVTLLSQGGAHGCGVTAADILRAVLVAGGRAFILGHNHPSGDVSPSTEDIEMTAAVALACEVTGLTFLDHVIVAAGGGQVSMFECGQVERSASHD